MDVESFVLVPFTLWEKKCKETPREEFNSGTSREPRNIESSKQLSFTRTRQAPTIQAQSELEQNQKQDVRITTFFGGTPATKKKSQIILQKMRDSSLINFTSDDNIIVNDINTDIPVASFINDLNKKRVLIPQIYLTILSILKLPHHLVSNENALSENRGDWLPF